MPDSNNAPALDGIRRNGPVAFAIRLLASGLFISLLPAWLLKGRKNTGAGFMGTVAAVATVPLLPENPAVYTVFLAVFTAGAIWISDRADFGAGQPDDPRIVIDEIAGYYFAIAFLPRTTAALLLCFILFRLFDTLKPFGIKKLDMIKNGFGVVIDDVASGIAVNILMWIAYLCAIRL
ncbi:MAG: phosphatidylglycerophosphatase A [Elusimicrobiaceae bacterium]|nr:phosphatidylglycerophosphatase A [Elusimicrobiaceae bacterium]